MNPLISPAWAVETDVVAILYRLTDRLYRARSSADVYSAALDAITEALGCARASILLFDAAGVMRFVTSRGLSEQYRQKLEGHTPWQPGERDPQPIFVSNIEQSDEPDWVKQTIRQEGIRALGFIPLVAEGGVIGKFMTYYEQPRTFPDHEIDLAITIARQVGFSIARSRSEKARQAVERELREGEARLRAMTEHAPVMIWMSDKNGKCLHLNKLLREFWGIDEEDIAAFDWSETIHPEDAAAIGQAMLNAAVQRSSVSIKGRYRDASGRYRTLQTDARPRVVNDEFLGMIGANVDITEREEFEAARQETEAHRELLIAELNHRVKNTLSVVQAIAHQTFRGTAEEAQRAFDGRLASLARSHDLLTHSSWRAVALNELVGKALQVDGPSNPRISYEGPNVRLRPKQAVALGMALHELYTNALKYGALSNADGRVTFAWTIDDAEGSLHMRWRENGGPPVQPPEKTGFGTVLLERSLKGDLNADVSTRFEPAGLACEITVKLKAAFP